MAILKKTLSFPGSAGIYRVRAVHMDAAWNAVYAKTVEVQAGSNLADRLFRIKGVYTDQESRSVLSRVVSINGYFNTEYYFRVCGVSADGRRSGWFYADPIRTALPDSPPPPPGGTDSIPTMFSFFNNLFRVGRKLKDGLPAASFNVFPAEAAVRRFGDERVFLDLESAFLEGLDADLLEEALLTYLVNADGDYRPVLDEAFWSALGLLLADRWENRIGSLLQVTLDDPFAHYLSELVLQACYDALDSELDLRQLDAYRTAFAESVVLARDNVLAEAVEAWLGEWQAIVETLRSVVSELVSVGTEEGWTREWDVRVRDAVQGQLSEALREIPLDKLLADVLPNLMRASLLLALGDQYFFHDSPHRFKSADVLVKALEHLLGDSLGQVYGERIRYVPVLYTGEFLAADIVEVHEYDLATLVKTAFVQGLQGIVSILVSPVVNDVRPAISYDDSALQALLGAEYGARRNAFVMGYFVLGETIMGE